MGRCYDTRYFVLPFFTFLKTHSSSFTAADAAGANKSADGSPLLTELMLLIFFSALFLTASVRIQCCCFFHPLPCVGRVEFRIGGTELSIPVTLSLLVTLLVPSSSAFWTIYLFMLVASFFSEAIHSFLTRISYHQSFVVWRDRASTQQSLPAPNGDDEPTLPGHEV